MSGFRKAGSAPIPSTIAGEMPGVEGETWD